MTAPMPRIWAVIPAAGVGRRMAADVPKQYLDLLGRPIVCWTLQSLLGHPAVHGGVIALADHDTTWETIAHDYPRPLYRVTGGAERSDSVLAALEFLLTHQGGEEDWVMVHDAVRPCVTNEDIDRLLAAGLSRPDGALLAVPVRDTLKRQEAGGRVRDTASRDGLWHALTPQLFPLRLLYQALNTALERGSAVTDDSQAMETAGYQPLLVEGRSTNIKVTRPHDLVLAEAVLKIYGNG
jgi:2-C-methyl-D-erythritol 4-phosphate cytidylyltransferase